MSRLTCRRSQETVVTQFQSLHSGLLSSYPPPVSRLIVFARAVFLWLHGKLGDLETRVSSPALCEEWAAQPRSGEELRELGLAYWRSSKKLLSWGAYLVAQFAVTGAFRRLCT